MRCADTRSEKVGKGESEKVSESEKVAGRIMEVRSGVGRLMEDGYPIPFYEAGYP